VAPPLLLFHFYTPRRERFGTLGHLAVACRGASLVGKSASRESIELTLEFVALLAALSTRMSGDNPFRIPGRLRHDVEQIVTLTDPFCAERLDAEYGALIRRLIAKLARKRPSPFERGDLRIWAAASIYAVGSVNFLFDRTRIRHRGLGRDEGNGILDHFTVTRVERGNACLEGTDGREFVPIAVPQEISGRCNVGWMISGMLAGRGRRWRLGEAGNVHPN
jgi:Domain of unknown function (DUF6398)